MDQTDRVEETLAIQRRFQEAGIDAREGSGIDAFAWATRCVRFARYGVRTDAVISRVKAFRAGQVSEAEPYQRGLLRALEDPDVERVIVDGSKPLDEPSEGVGRVLGRVRELARQTH